jgi:cellulose synthase/poly-beta-1,6-N-acetylglucosamine synthase-like glycosyltransferase
LCLIDRSGCRIFMYFSRLLIPVRNPKGVELLSSIGCNENINKTGLVSIIIPSYNMSDFVPDAVHSVLAQTYSKLEVHVVDDGSTDNTRNVMAQFNNDDRVIYHYRPNGGVSSARNFGIRAAQGEFIALCDADDLWETHKLEMQLQCFKRQPETGLVYSGVTWVDKKNRAIEAPWNPAFYSGNVSDKLLQVNFVSCSSVLVRKSCFDEVGYFDTSLRTCEDFDLWLRISVKYEFGKVDKPLCRYRVWAGQVSSGDELRFFEDVIRVKRRFLAANPKLIDPVVVKEIWAELFSSMAQCTMRMKKGRLRAIGCIWQSLHYRPFRMGTWKSAVKVLVDRVY